VALEDLLKHCNPLPNILLFLTCSLLLVVIEIDSTVELNLTTNSVQGAWNSCC